MVKVLQEVQLHPDIVLVLNMVLVETIQLLAMMVLMDLFY